MTQFKTHRFNHKTVNTHTWAWQKLMKQKKGEINNIPRTRLANRNDNESKALHTLKKKTKVTNGFHIKLRIILNTTFC